MDSLESNIRGLKGPILVTGASGFIGANLFKKLYNVRDDVYAIVRGGKGWRLRDIPDEQTIEVDLNDYVMTRHLVDSSAPQTVFHCAATVLTHSRTTPRSSIRPTFSLRSTWSTAWGRGPLSPSSARGVPQSMERIARRHTKIAFANPTARMPSPKWRWLTISTTWASISSFRR